MKVLLIRNNEISIEFIEEHLARNGASGEVIVAMPENLALEITGSIDFDLVVCGVEGYLKNVIEDFLFNVKQISRGSYSIAVLRRESLKEMGPVFFSSIDDFITCPVDSDEFALRLMKAITKAKGRRTFETGAIASEFGRIHDVSAPSSKLFDDDIPDVSIRDVVDEEEEQVSASMLVDTYCQGSEDELPEADETEYISYGEMSYEELLRQRELELAREAELTAIKENIVQASFVDDTEALTEETSVQAPFDDDLSNGELLGQRELMLEREAAVRVLAEETEEIAPASETELHLDELSYDELLNQRELMLESEAAGSVAADPETAPDDVSEYISDEMSYDELLRQRELMLEREASVRIEENDVSSEMEYEKAVDEADSYELPGQLTQTTEALSGPDLTSADEIEVPAAFMEDIAEVSAAEEVKDSKPEVRSVKEEKLQEEIDLLKHLRKDYGAKTSKVEKIGLKKEKKQKKADAGKEKPAPGNRRGIFTLITRVMASILVLLAGATTYFYAASNFGDGIPIIAGYKLTAVRTAEMEPALRLGDLVISVDVPVDEISENDIITFRTLDSKGAIECNRVVRVEVSPEGKVLLIAQGDGMSSEYEVAVEPDMIVGKVTRYIPFAGFIVNVDTLRFALASVK